MSNETLSSRKIALVTGASAGIGAEFAKQLAAQNFNLVITARRMQRLEALANELRSEYDTKVLCLAADLAEPSAVQTLIDTLDEHQLTIHTLINNAGYGVPGHLTAVEWQQHQDFMQVMVNSVIELCYRLLPATQAQQAGQIINVASLAGIVPSSASHTLYAASKAFLIKLSEALALENEPLGIKVQALCPGFTYSEFHDVLGMREQVSKMPGYMWMSAESVVSESLRETAKPNGKIMLISGPVNRFIARLSHWLPQKTAVNMVKRRSKQYRAQE